ncbi:MAG: hypothetical protein KGZ37_03165 [Nitrosarchaeum sp.]|nr:hypothetical protein [Nitrosarchaeum sp.]
MPFHSKEEITERINLVRRYNSFGLSPKEIQESLLQHFGIQVTVQQIYLDLKEIKKGTYDTFLDNLLDIHYPAIYEQTLLGLSKDIEYFKEFSERKNADEKLLLKARNYHARLSIELISTLHKGAVIRAMKQLSVKAKILARDTIQNESMIRRRGPINQITINETKKKVVEFDENLQLIKEEIIEMSPELEKRIE